jgi:hypothetical protein
LSGERDGKEVRSVGVFDDEVERRFRVFDRTVFPFWLFPEVVEVCDDERR